MSLINLIKLENVPRLVEKYSGVGAVPLALPKFELDDAEQLINQIDPELLNPFRENPFTKSLASYA